VVGSHIYSEAGSFAVSVHIADEDGSQAVARSLVSVDGLTHNELYVQSLYEDFLGRTGSIGELDNWVAALPSIGIQGVAFEIAHSGEAYRRIVDELYQTLLGRPADALGEAQWVNSMETGDTEEQIMVGILASSEFAAHANALIDSGDSNVNFIEALYSILLHRSAGLTEIQSWVSRLPVLGRNGVANGFATSSEFRSDAVRTFYGDPTLNPLPFQPFWPDLLHRTSPPSTAEVNSWVNSGQDLMTIEVGFAASNEYYVEHAN